MPLYGKKQKPSALNSTAKGVLSNLSGLRDTPYKTRDSYPEKPIKFLNAKATPTNHQFIMDALSYIHDTNIHNTSLKSFATGKYAPIFLGSPGSPSEEFLYSNPEFADIENFLVKIMLNVFSISYSLICKAECKEIENILKLLLVTMISETKCLILAPGQMEALYYQIDQN